MFPFDNYEQIAKVSSIPLTQTATTVLPNLLHSPLFPTHTALPPQTAHPPQHSPFSYPSSHTCLSNHSAADTTCKSVTPTFQREPTAGVGTTSSSSSAPPHLASVQAATDSASVDRLVSTASPLLMADTPLTLSAGLDLVVDFSSYLLQQDILWPSSSSVPPPLTSKHHMVLRSRQLKTANLAASAAPVTASPRVLHSPSSEPLAFSDADKYVVWHNAMCDEIKALHSNHI